MMTVHVFIYWYQVHQKHTCISDDNVLIVILLGFVVETAIGVSTEVCDRSEMNTQINHIHRTTWFFERSKDVKIMIVLKSRFTNVDLQSSRFVIIAICGCEFLRL